MKLTLRAAQAITNLRNNPDWNDYLQWLEEQTAVLNEQLVYSPDHPTALLRVGMTRALAEMAKAITAAPQTVETLKHKPGNR